MSAVQAAGANPQWLLLDMPGAPQVGVTLQETFCLLYTSDAADE